MFIEPPVRWAQWCSFTVSLLAHVAAAAVLVGLLRASVRPPAPVPIPLTLLQEAEPRIDAEPAVAPARAAVSPAPRPPARAELRAPRSVRPPAPPPPAASVGQTVPAAAREAPSDAPRAETSAEPAAASAVATVPSRPPTDEGSAIFGDADVDARARAVERPQPAYPARARMLGKQADRELLVTVSADGRVLDVTIPGGSGDEFDREAIAGVRRWRFVPAQRAGRTVASRVRVTVHFRLDP